MNNDYINAGFEFLAGLFVLNNCRVLWQQKIVRGVSIISTTFFFLWGCWNLWFYPSLDQIWSYRGGLLIVVANCAWVFLMVYFKHREKNHPC